MNPIYSQIYLDLQHKAIESVNLKQYDYESRYIRFHITDNGNPYALTSDIQANIKIHKPDGTKVVNTAVVDAEDNEITAAVTKQMTSVYGVLYADLTLFKDGQVISTMPFHLHVEKSPVQNEDIMSTDEIGLLEDLISDVQKEEANRQANEQTRITAEEIRSAHEEQRTEAEALRSENEAVRIIAENTRTVNEQARVVNESARQEQEARRQEQASAAIADANEAARDAAAAAADLQNKLDTHHFVLTADKDIADGVPGLDANAKIPVTELYEATTSVKGITQLTDSTTSTSITTAATPNSVKTACDTSKAYTDARIADLINGAPSTLDTLGEIADAMAENQTVVEALDAAIGTKVDTITGDTFIGAAKSGTTVTVSHKDVTRTNSASVVSPAHGGTFTAVKSVASDSKGHVTAVDMETITLPMYEAATSSTDGLMSAKDKVRLEELVTGTNTTYSLSKTGSTITLTGSDGSITSVTDSDTTYGAATANAAGLMSASDKTKLNGITASADAVSFSRSLSSGTKIGTITINGIGTDLYCQTNTDTNTTYSAGTGISLSGTTFSNAGVRSISTGTANGTISVNTNGSTSNVAVYGLGSAAYTASSAYAAASHTHSYLPLNGGTITGNVDINYNKIISWGNTAHITATANQALYIAASSETAYKLFLGVRESKWGLSPVTSGYLLLGLPSYRWGQIYSTVAAISTSDRNQKKEIHSLSEKYTALFTLLQPVSYRFIDGTSGRTHIGFISQDVEEAMEQVGLSDLEFAGFCKDKKQIEVKTRRIEYQKDADGNPVTDDNGDPIAEEYEDITYEDELDEDGNPVYIYSLRYEEFIALNTAVIQNQQQQIHLLEERLEKLEEKVELLSADKSD